MKAADTQRAMVLTEALRALDAGVAEALPGNEPDSGWTLRGVRLGVGSMNFTSKSSDDFSVDGWCDIDIVTGRKIMAQLRALIVTELRALGVEDVS